MIESLKTLAKFLIYSGRKIPTGLQSFYNKSVNFFNISIQQGGSIHPNKLTYRRNNLKKTNIKNS